MAAIPLAAWAVAGCTSADKTLVNGLIAEALTTDDSVAVEDSQKTAFTVEFNEAADEATVTWDKGPLKDTPRTFIQDGPTSFALDTPTEEGWLVADAWAYSGFALGYVNEIATGASAVGAGHFGTEPTLLPETGTVTYNGGVAGVLLNADTESGIDPLWGDATVIANFGTGGVEGVFDELEADSYGAVPDVTFTGEMSKGKATYSGDSFAVGGLAASGSLVGGFYGPGAAETSGVFDITSGGVNPIRPAGGFIATSVP